MLQLIDFELGRGCIELPSPARAFMPGTAAAIAWNAAERLMAMIISQFSRGNFSIGASRRG
jgi:hypothetical protein